MSQRLRFAIALTPKKKRSPFLIHKKRSPSPNSCTVIMGCGSGEEKGDEPEAPLRDRTALVGGWSAIA